MGGKRSVWLKATLVSALAACLGALLTAPGAASARPGALDRDFNGDGKVVTVFPEPERVRSYPVYALPFEFATGRIAMAAAPGRKLVLASSKAIVEYKANGARNRRFGGNGTVSIEQPEGLHFQLADVAVDPEGRVLIAGTTKVTTGIGMGGPPVAGPIPSIATLRRYLPNGQPDPSFGTGGDGLIRSYFGAPPATFEGRAYPDPAVSLTGLTVDARSRPVVSGSLVAEVGRCPGTETRYEKSNAFVARLTENGGVDPSFDGGATRGIRELAWLSSLTPGPHSVFGVGATTEPCHVKPQGEPSVLVSIGDNGPSGPFGGNGFWSRPYMRVSDLAAAPGGKLVLLARTVELSRGRWVESRGSAIRLRPNGTLDRGFGHDGKVRLRLPRRSSVAAIATDRRGRVLLAGTIRRKPRHGRRRHLEFLLTRMTAKGRLDRRFGHRGRVATGFARRANVRAGGLLVDPANRIVVGGKFAGPGSRNAFAVARYLGGR